jgi:xanthine dehydrogenase accessory factor
MRNIYIQLLDWMEQRQPLALATIIEASGSTPQKAGASAIFSQRGLLGGTLGGGLLEADAERKALRALKRKTSLMYEFSLQEDISSEDGAICGGKVKILIDILPRKYRKVFLGLKRSLSAGEPGILATHIQMGSPKKVFISRAWLKKGQKLLEIQDVIHSVLKDLTKGKEIAAEAKLVESGEDAFSRSLKGSLLFFEPQFPLPKLVLAGAGHIGQAVAHLGNLLGFEVTVIDDRPEFANRKRLSEADTIIVDEISRAIRTFPVDPDTYIVIVTRGHAKDAEALRACIRSQAAYVGMIGSNRKVRLMQQKFLKEGWATRDEFDRIYAPIGIPIHSKTVEEIAVSIAAQLVKVRQKAKEKEVLK